METAVAIVVVVTGGVTVVVVAGHVTVVEAGETVAEIARHTGTMIAAVVEIEGATVAAAGAVMGEAGDLAAAAEGVEEAAAAGKNVLIAQHMPLMLITYHRAAGKKAGQKKVGPSKKKLKHTPNGPF